MSITLLIYHMVTIRKGIWQLMVQMVRKVYTTKITGLSYKSLSPQKFLALLLEQH